MERYNKITEKQKREIVLLRGSGCVYGKCTFCDYHRDRCADTAANFALNRSVLERVTGEFGELEVINSGSVFELDEDTMSFLRHMCRQKQITTLHFEAHYLYRDKIPALRQSFPGVTLKMKLGLETFDDTLRERVLKKGIGDRDPAVICKYFDEANFLFGIAGQTAASMERDIRLGLSFFQRICINILCRNSTNIRPSPGVIAQFLEEVYPRWKNDERVDILLQNTDFGVGD